MYIRQSEFAHEARIMNFGQKYNLIEINISHEITSGIVKFAQFEIHFEIIMKEIFWLKATVDFIIK